MRRPTRRARLDRLYPVKSKPRASFRYTSKASNCGSTWLMFGVPPCGGGRNCAPPLPYPVAVGAQRRPNHLAITGRCVAPCAGERLHHQQPPSLLLDRIVSAAAARREQTLVTHRQVQV